MVVWPLSLECVEEGQCCAVLGAQLARQLLCLPTHWRVLCAFALVLVSQWPVLLGSHFRTWRLGACHAGVCCGM